MHKEMVQFLDMLKKLYTPKHAHTQQPARSPLGWVLRCLVRVHTEWVLHTANLYSDLLSMTFAAIVKVVLHKIYREYSY